MKVLHMKKTGWLLICMLCMTGCLAYARHALPHEESDLILQTDLGAEQTEDDALEQMVIQENAITEAGLQECYAYQMLSEDEKVLYEEIADALLNFRENVNLSSCDKEEISHVFQCVLNDHPEMFYVDGYRYTEYRLGDTLRKITFTGVYRFSPEEVEERQKLIDNYVNQCLAQIPETADEYAKVKYIYEYLIHHTEYDASAENKQNLCSVFLEGKSVCQGYAKATQYLLNRAGIFATLVLGRVEGGEKHAWNLVRIDGDYYYVDTTWGDASYQAVEGSASYPGERIPTINYDYLCVSTNQLELTHTIDNVVEMPECTAMKNNYYVREGVYITGYNEEQLARIFREGYEKGSTYVTLKCADQEVYRQLQDALIINQGIFRYLDCPEGVVSYTANGKQYSMSFWL